MRRFNLLSLVTGLLVSFAAAQSARAAMTLSIYSEADNVVATANGSIDLTSLTFVESGANFASIEPDGAALLSGELEDLSVYVGISGPLSWGSGGQTFATSSTGDGLLIIGLQGAIAVPEGYTSGANLTSEAVFSGATIAGLGLTPGTYTYNWGSGLDADSLVVNISAAAPPSVPEPSTALLGIIGLASAIAFPRMQTKFSK
jgi:hypothetical protein